jgi:hypothetical protein
MAQKSGSKAVRRRRPARRRYTTGDWFMAALGLAVLALFIAIVVGEIFG